MGKDAYTELVLQLGDLARERLASKHHALKTMERVFRAEDAVLARRQELATLEQQMNDEDLAYRQDVAAAEDEIARQRETTKKWRKVVGDVEHRVKDIRKRIAKRRFEVQDAQLQIAKLQNRSEGGYPELLRTLRMGQMKARRELEDLEAELARAFTPAPGQPGGEALRAQSRIVQLEESIQAGKAALDQKLAELDAAVRQKEEELRAAEELLEQVVFHLGEEVFRVRVADPELASLYPKLEKLAAKRR